MLLPAFRDGTIQIKTMYCFYVLYSML